MSSSSDSPTQSQLESSEPVIYGPDEHSIRKQSIDDDARKVVFRLQRAGYKAYIVGGGVRDLMLGKTPKDFDVSTDATPREIKALFRNCRIIGRRFKLAHVFFAHGKNIEVSTFRDVAEWTDPVEGETSEGGPVASDNVYGTEATDAVRRDLTINGLFLDVSTMEIIDYVGGMTDLKEGIIRVIGDPDLRFREDPVRMIRVVRHSARNGFRIDSDAWQSILANADKIAGCSQVRVFDELRKDFTSGCFLTILSLLLDTGLLEHLLPELLENNGRLLSAESDLSQCLERIDDMVVNGQEVSPTVVLTLLAIFTGGEAIWLKDLIDTLSDGGDLVQLVNSAFTRLTVPRKEKERIVQLVQTWLRIVDTPARSFKPGQFKRAALLDEVISMIEVTQSSRDDSMKLHALHGLFVDEDSANTHPAPMRPARRGH